MPVLFQLHILVNKSVLVAVVRAGVGNKENSAAFKNPRNFAYAVINIGKMVEQ